VCAFGSLRRFHPPTGKLCEGTGNQLRRVKGAEICRSSGVLGMAETKHLHGDMKAWTRNEYMKRFG
jgi:hypothetical protein